MQTSHSSRINFKYCEHLPTLSLYLFIPSRIPLYPLSPPLMNLRINDAADGKISIQPINSAVLCQSHNSFLTIFSLVMDIRHYTTHLQISRLTIGVNPYSGTILLQTPLSSIIIHTHLCTLMKKVQSTINPSTEDGWENLIFNIPVYTGSGR